MAGGDQPRWESILRIWLAHPRIRVRTHGMLRDSYLLQGAALLIAIDRVGPIGVRELAEIHGSAYELRKGNDAVQVLFKIATSRAGRHRWQFTISSAEVGAIGQLESRLHPVFLAFVCQKDGVCCMPDEVLFSLISKTHPGGQAVSISREHRGRYWLTGPGRTALPTSIPASDWPLRLFANKP